MGQSGPFFSITVREASQLQGAGQVTGSANPVSDLARLEQRLEKLAWQNVEAMPDSPWAWFNTPRARAVLIYGTIAVLALSHWVIPLSMVPVHSFIQHLYFLPIVVAGLTFGWRAAVLATAVAGLAQAPHIWRTLGPQPIYAIDQILELPVFGVAGVIAGLLAERERGQRLKLEKTKQQLEQVYQELQQNFERLKKAERLYVAGQLSAGLAHELRNPLASISGAAGILKRGRASAEDHQACLEIIEKETQRLNKLLSGFLDFARPRAPRFQKVDLSLVLDSVAALAAHATGAESIDLRREIEDSLPEVDCDPEQVKQVILNLLINAIQATPGRGVVRLGAAAGPDRISIYVHDEGCGIPADQRDHIFTPFFTTKDNGTGLGLAVAAKIVEQHGGLLTAGSNPGKGMTFRLELPLDRMHPL
jgi:signal transduction histidine kinase